MKKLAVVALGGNALLRSTQRGTIDEQETNVRESIENLIFLIKDGYNLIITHGNGPQVGNIIMRNDAGETLYDIAPMPLDICVADSQGGIGYMIERILRNMLTKYNINKNVVSLITQVLVDKDDPAFRNPVKRIGKICSKAEAQKLNQQKGWEFKLNPSKKGWQRVVPSPSPKQILNHEIIKTIALKGDIVIAVGGGGIPVYYENTRLVPIDAVVDKDIASALLAKLVGAKELYILTNVPYIFKNFGKSNQEILEFLDYKDTFEYLKAGEFGKGSMAPKISACLDFVKAGGEKAIITEATKLEDKNFGSKITMVYDD